MAVEATVQMKERAPAEDIEHFMQRLQVALGAAHSARSPLCVATAVEYVKVPVEDDKIGGASGGTA